MPRFAFWINDVDSVVSELDDHPVAGDEISLGESRYVVSLERPNHDATVEAAYTVEPASPDGS